MDEKLTIPELQSALPPLWRHEPPEAKQNVKRSFATVGVLVILGLYFSGGYVAGWERESTGALKTNCANSAALGNPDAVWDRIIPSTKLKWTKCYDDKECAKLSVPLDYSDPSGRQAAIALLKVPSKIPRGHKGYRGPVLFNPGGPGGSGVQMVRGRGEQFRTILGDDYDIIGFDPRGIGFTQPSLVLFPEASEKAAWDLRHEAIPPLNATPDALARSVARWEVFGDLAKERLADTAQYVSTALVSRDMLRITEAHGFAKLKYWGFSYGSVLGITFAAMFPDKVDRLIVDGVCDTYNYYETLWSNNLRDTDAGLYMFYEGCVEAGPKGCALYAADAARVKARTEAIFATLKKGPVPVFTSKSSTAASYDLDYGLVDYRMARNGVFQFLYSPYGRRGISGADVARALAAIEKNDGRPLWDLSAAFRDKEFRCNCGEDKTPEAPRLPETTYAIACSDGDVVEDDIDELQEHYEGMAKMSNFAELWGLRVACAGWKIRAKERFNGPFIGNTSHPIMLIGNTADPVTPLWNARKMALGFKNAAVLHQKSAGHCSLSAASLCTAKIVRNYFRNGDLPPPGKECEVESRIFGEPAKTDLSIVSVEDEELLQALRTLSHDFEVPMFHI